MSGLVDACFKSSPSVISTPECSPDCVNRHPRNYNPHRPLSHLDFVITWINKNAKPFDYVISLHMNSGPAEATGVEVYYSTGAGKTRITQAKAALDALSGVLGLKARGVFQSDQSQHARLGILDNTKPPALLFELGFVTNPDDVKAVSERGVNAVIEAMRAIREAH